MLLLAGVTRSAGSVDAGDTVMDHLDQERERGITIQAAATAFSWTGHSINLIDTPGHVDFTIEVERTTRVLDGAALIVDAVAGAQAQTETVWRQAASHGVPALAFVNKMDREGADFGAALTSLEQRLGLVALAVQTPLLAADGGSFCGAVDLVDMVAYSYTSAEVKQGGRAQRGAPLELERAALPLVSEAGVEEPCNGTASGAPLHHAVAHATAARAHLVERVAELDPEGEVAELYLEEATVPAATLAAAIRRLTIDGHAVPALCGAALAGVGVEALLDAICRYLPNPDDRPPPTLQARRIAALGVPTGGGKAAAGVGVDALGNDGGAPTTLALEEAGSAVAFAFKVRARERSGGCTCPWLERVVHVPVRMCPCACARARERVHVHRGSSACLWLKGTRGSCVRAASACTQRVPTLRRWCTTRTRSGRSSGCVRTMARSARGRRCTTRGRVWTNGRHGCCACMAKMRLISRTSAAGRSSLLSA